MASTLSSLANHSLTKQTWSSYKTAYRMLKLCFKNCEIPFPLPHSYILTFVSWLNNRNLSASTINSYLAGLRQLHLAKGLQLPNIRSDLVNQILAGKKNVDLLLPVIKPTRIPVTPTILRILKTQITGDNLPYHDKRLYWLICTLAFHGSFRIGELLTRSPTTYDPNYTLLCKDIAVNITLVDNVPVKFLEVNLKHSKCSKNKPVVIDIYPTNSDLCPVRAYAKWFNTRASSLNLPAFRLSSGKTLTPNTFNAKLRSWLNSYIDYSVCSISGHSFRAGIPSILATMGFPDKDIQAAGRWSSRAFELYCKL